MTQQMYLGPTVPGLVKENEIFRGELPDAVKRGPRRTRILPVCLWGWIRLWRQGRKCRPKAPCCQLPMQAWRKI